MRVHLAFGHGVIERFLGGDRFAVPIVELTVLPVDVEVPACLQCAGKSAWCRSPFPGELLGLVGG